MTRRIWLPVLVAAVFGAQASLRADIIASYTVDEMCDMADLIVEGVHLHEDLVRIDRVHKPQAGVCGPGAELEVVNLGKHTRELCFLALDPKRAPPEPPLLLSILPAPEPRRLEAEQLVLFLKRDEKTGRYASFATIFQEAKWGSSGLFWVDGKTIYGYSQTVNPGPLRLVPGGMDRYRVPPSLEALRQEIALGLVHSREWRRSLATADPGARARLLARYLLVSTSPEGDKGTHRDSVRQPLASVGKDAVPAIIQVLRTAPASADLNTAVLTLFDIGPPAALAVPDLIDLLDQPDRAFTGYVLSALGATGDPRALPPLRSFAQSPDARLASDARQAIARHRTRAPTPEP